MATPKVTDDLLGWQ